MEANKYENIITCPVISHENSWFMLLVWNDISFKHEPCSNLILAACLVLTLKSWPYKNLFLQPI